MRPALGFGGGFEPRRQRFTGDGLAWPQIGGFADAPGGFGAADPQPVGQRMTQLAAQLGLAGLLGDLVDQHMPGRRQSAGLTLEPLQHGQTLGCGQHIEGLVEQA
jgi:hypothetical protein